MALVTSTSASSTNLHDVSFSSYLNRAEEPFKPKLAESSQNPNSLISTPNEHVHVGRMKVEDGEIGIFGAEKYFKGAMDEENPKFVHKDNHNTRCQKEKDEPDDIGLVKSKTHPGTPSVRSESSWNSQSTLLASIPKNHSSRKTNKAHGKSFLASLGCNCYCNDKNSVEIDETIGENGSNKSFSNGGFHGKETTKQSRKNGNKSLSNTWAKEEMSCRKFDEMGIGLKREDCFSFPVLNSKAGNLAVKVKSQGDETARKSLDAFGSPILQKGKKSFSLERKLNMLNWDAISPRVEGIDAESDASSDLFELESFSNNANRGASDGMSSCVTPTTCYAPSEASIEWSVVTASAADFSVMSDSEELKTTINPNRMVRNPKITPANEMQKQRPGILLGCKSQKAVRVAGDVYRTNEMAITDFPGRHHRLDPFKPVARFQAETKLTGFDSRHGQHAFDTSSISQSHSAHLLYIQ